MSCLHCMVAHPEWRANAHGSAGTNRRFFSLYNGTDITGTTTVSPGYKLDFPGTAGNCAACHALAAAVRGLRTFAAADMNELQDVEREGVFCEFCHKVGNDSVGVVAAALQRLSAVGSGGYPGWVISCCNSTSSSTIETSEVSVTG